MQILSPTRHKRLNEIAALLLLVLGLLTLLSLVSYDSRDPSWNTASQRRPVNLTGYLGSYIADLGLQTFGVVAYLIPLLVFLLGWKWLRSEDIPSPAAKILGGALLVSSACSLCAMGPAWRVFGGTIWIGGAFGLLLEAWLRAGLNTLGALVVALTALIVSLYLLSSFTFARLSEWLAGSRPLLRRLAGSARDLARRFGRSRRRKTSPPVRAAAHDPEPDEIPVARAFEPLAGEPAEQPAGLPVIPICPFDEDSPPLPEPPRRSGPVLVPRQRAADQGFRLPPTDLLNEPAARSPYDEQELQSIAVRVKSKFEEFHVLGSVVQINPGPVVTTFEFKPEAGIKYNRITALNEDLCLGLHAESILIERIPGKPTVGIEVPNTRREVISLRQVLESEEFTSSASRLTISLGKDINGRIKVAALDSMPHLLIAGSTGSGKSVMINSLIMSVLFKSTPEEVRMIMVDPKRVELGMYEGIPHLLTPVIIDPRKAANALRNAVLEMERRLRLLAEYGVRNIDQYNKKIRKLEQEPRNLFEEADAEEPRALPYILILIDELADLMMIEGRNVEESVTRLAQMARAVGMHLVLATQRPSVDVITGLIKANFPARISFRVATRVDSRTILDIMGAEHLLGKGDMLFLPQGSSRLIRVHGAFVTESEINDVVNFWKEQALPEYDGSFLEAPPAEEDEAVADAELSGQQDPAYEEAVRIVLEMGKASTSTLQRRLRLGYGRAARILDIMHRDGIIGPPDGSKPREVLKRPDWLREVEDSLR